MLTHTEESAHSTEYRYRKFNQSTQNLRLAGVLLGCTAVGFFLGNAKDAADEAHHNLQAAKTAEQRDRCKDFVINRLSSELPITVDMTQLSRRQAIDCGLQKPFTDLQAGVPAEQVTRRLPGDVVVIDPRLATTETLPSIQELTTQIVALENDASRNDPGAVNSFAGAAIGLVLARSFIRSVL